MSDLARKILSSNRRAEKRGVKVAFTVEDWEYLLEFHGHSCAYCGELTDQLTQDHVIPLCKGGSHTKENIVPSCKPCNGRKGSKDLDVFQAEIVRATKGG